jgi:hypothetical protein
MLLNFFSTAQSPILGQESVLVFHFSHPLWLS